MWEEERKSVIFKAGMSGDYSQVPATNSTSSQVPAAATTSTSNKQPALQSNSSGNSFFSIIALKPINFSWITRNRGSTRSASARRQEGDRFESRAA